jgi:hypothetical protein
MARKRIGFSNSPENPIREPDKGMVIVMKKMAERNERKVVKEFPDGAAERVDAILFREVDSIGETLGYVLHYVLSGVQVNNRDAEALIHYYRNS